jgi:hypothetical protein
MSPRDAFAFYKTLNDVQKDEILDIIQALSMESNKWRLVEAVQQWKESHAPQKGIEREGHLDKH